jgi:hypothetical protein
MRQAWIRKAAFAIALGGSLLPAADNHYLLSLDFADTAAAGKQSVNLPSLAPNADVSVADGVADFGAHGVVSQAAFSPPAGPFTIESRFWVRSYAYIQDLVNTATWDDGPVQGLIFRIGGGFFYPPLPRTAYGDNALYDKSLSDFDNTGRADLSRCVGDFAFATKSGGTAQWLEVYTDRCAELGRWNHMVSVWDGKDARIYLNGFDVTDKWRLNGVGSQPKLDSSARLTVGGRRPQSGGDDRHFDGKMDFVRILDTAMGETQIRKRYQETLTRDTAADFCHGVLIPVSPAAGELCDKDSKFKFTVTAHGACVDKDVKWDFKPGDTAEVQFARDAGFKNVFFELKVGSLEFNIDKALAEKGGVFSGPVYWRVRFLVPIAKALLKTAGSEPERETGWSDPSPLFLSYSLPATRLPEPARSDARLRLRAVQGGFLLEGWTEASAPILYGLDGKAAPVTATRAGVHAWRLEPNRDGRAQGGIYLLKTSRGPVPLAF